MTRLADALFTTTQQQVLGLLYGQPQRSFYTKEIIRLTGMGVATITRELARLQAAGVISLTKIGNQHHYQADPGCPIFAELRGIVEKALVKTGMQKTPGTYDRTGHADRGALRVQEPRAGAAPVQDSDSLIIARSLVVSRAALHTLVQRYHIRRLALFGSAARGELRADSDIDLLIEFENNETPGMTGMMELQEALSKLFGGRRVDVATPSILKNPYRQRAIEKDLEELYTA